MIDWSINKDNEIVLVPRKKTTTKDILGIVKDTDKWVCPLNRFLILKNKKGVELFFDVKCSNYLHLKFHIDSYFIKIIKIKQKFNVEYA